MLIFGIRVVSGNAFRVTVDRRQHSFRFRYILRVQLNSDETTMELLRNKPNRSHSKERVEHKVIGLS